MLPLTNMETSKCFYKDEYPQINDVVMVCVRRIMPQHIDCVLLEYSNLKGEFEETCNSIHVGDILPASIIAISADKCQPISLTMRNITLVHKEKCTMRFARAKVIDKLLSLSAIQLTLKELYERITWHFESKYQKKTAAFDIFKEAINDPSVFDECNLDNLTRDILLYYIKEELAQLNCYLRADFKCYINETSIDDAIDIVCSAGLDLALPICTETLGTSKYRISINANNFTEGKKALEQLMKHIKSKIMKLNGHFNVLEAPGDISEEDAVLAVAFGNINIK